MLRQCRLQDDSSADRSWKTHLDNVFILSLSLSLSLTLLVFIYFPPYFSFSQTLVPAAPVSMETAAGATAGRRGSRLTPVSVVKATRGRGAIKSYWICRLQTGTPPPPPLLSWLLLSPPQPQPPLNHRSQPPSPPPQCQHLPPCSHGNPNLARGCWWCHGRQTGWDKLPRWTHAYCGLTSSSESIKKTIYYVCVLFQVTEGLHCVSSELCELTSGTLTLSLEVPEETAVK